MKIISLLTIGSKVSRVVINQGISQSLMIRLYVYLQNGCMVVCRKISYFFPLFYPLDEYTDLYLG